MVMKQTAPSSLSDCDTCRGHTCSMGHGDNFCCLLLSHVPAKPEAQVRMAMQTMH